MLWLAGAAAQTATNHAPLINTNLTLHAPTLLTLTNGNRVIILSTNRFGSLGNHPLQVPEQPKRLQTPPSGLAPGIYETEPYTCIIIVPGEHPDDRMAIHPPDPAPNMPVLKPDLRFIPVQPK